jgi:hypothetical protein
MKAFVFRISYFVQRFNRNLLLKSIVHCSLFIVNCSFLSSCKKDQPTDNKTEHRFQAGKGVFVMNEGNFNWGNASLDYVAFDEAKIHRNIFNEVNDFPVGDVLHSFFYDNGKLHLVANNSGKIHVVNVDDFKYLYSSPQLQSPRNIIGYLDKYYVSDLYANKIHVLRRSDLQLLSTINLPGWVEQMQIIGQELVMANVRKHMLYFMDLPSQTITDSLSVSDAPMYLQLDKDGMLWVLSYGELFPETQGAITQVNPIDKSIIKSFSFPLGSHPTRLQINSTVDTLLFIDKHVYKMAINATQLPSELFINGNGKNFYALGIHQNTGDVWVGDAIDFVQSGRVYQYSASGNYKNEYVCGIIPGVFFFY